MEGWSLLATLSINAGLFLALMLYLNRNRS